MSAVVIGFVPGPVGRAALDQAIIEARRRAVKLVVVNTTRGDALVDQRFLQGDASAELRAELAVLDVPAELRQVNDGHDIAESLDTIAAEVDAEVIVIGLRRRSQVGKLIMGSAASRILLTVRRPILVVKV